MLTADTITDAQIQELWNSLETRKIYPHAGEARNRREFRARCAEILNASNGRQPDKHERNNSITCADTRGVATRTTLLR